MNRQRLFFWWRIGTFAAALLLMLVPLPVPHVLDAFKPYWPALVLLYWALESAEPRVTLGLAFCYGLIADLLTGVLLGEQALRLCVLSFIALRFRARLRFFPMWQQTLAVLALLLNDRFLQLVVRAFAGEAMPPAWWWCSPLVSAMLWPLLSLLLDDMRMRLRLL